MNDNSRKILDSAFSKLAKISLALMCVLVCAFTLPIIIKGVGAFAFSATAEHENFLEENFGYAPSKSDILRSEKSAAAKKKIFAKLSEYEQSSCPEAEDAVRKTIQRGFERLEKNAEKLASAKDCSASQRCMIFAEVSQMAWENAAAEIEAAVKRAADSGAETSFGNFLKKESKDVASRAKAFSSSKQMKGLHSPVARASLRRSISEIPVGAMTKGIALLAEKNAAYLEFKAGLNKLLGPENAKQKAAEKLPRNKYGQTRMDMAEKVFDESVAKIRIVDDDGRGEKIFKRVDTAAYFKGTKIAEIFADVKKNFDELMQPHFVFYGGFFTHDPVDANIFGGIFPMIVGTFYLTAGAMLIAAPLGIIAAIYFSEYAKPSPVTDMLKMCVGTLAGVPSIVFGLFGLAFLIDTLKISDGKSVVAGAATLALLILPTIIQSCAESLKSVPQAYREASLGLGAGKWRTICTVILPAALPSMLTGIIISMGRAAGETAPIIFTAATSTGVALSLSQVFTNPTPALPWNIYNICSEHEAADMVQHVQYGMVFTLMAIVLSLNLAAIIIRAKLQRK